MVLDNILLKKIEDVKQFIANMIPIAGNQIPSADTTNGSSGTNIDYAKSDHTHPKSTLYAEEDHAHSQYLTTHQDISGKLNISQTGYKGKNVVVDNTTGNITFEDKPTIPQASTSSPLADMTGGAIGSDSKYAKADHQHPLSSAYATSGHTHTTSDLPSTIINETDINNIIDTLNTNDIFTYSNKNVEQNGNTICLVGKLYGDDIEGKTIQFYNNNTLLGSSNTDVYGTALYDYVCTGGGKKEIVTKYGTLQSTTYEVLDTLLYDDGTNSDDYFDYASRTNRTNDGSEVTLTNNQTGSSPSYYLFNIHGTSHSTIADVTEWGTSDFCFEVELLDSNNSGSGFVFNDGSEKLKTFTSLGSITEASIKGIYTNGVMSIYLNGSSTAITTVSLTNPFRFGFYIYPSKYIKVKNLKIYPI